MLQPRAETAGHEVSIGDSPDVVCVPWRGAELAPCPPELDAEASVVRAEPGWYSRHRGAPGRHRLLFGCICLPHSHSSVLHLWLTVSPTWEVLSVRFSSVQSLSRVWFFVTPWTAACQASLFITNSWSLLKLMSIESVMPSNHLILCHPLLFLPSISPSIRAFSKVSSSHQVAMYWSFSFSISPSNEYSGLTSFRMDWLDLLAVQGTLKSLLQHHSSKASVLWGSAFFTVQLAHPRSSLGFMNSSKNSLLNKSSKQLAKSSKQLAESSKQATTFSPSSP